MKRTFINFKCRALLIAFLFLSPVAASAGPITIGVWSQVVDVDGDLDPFWDGLSWDCPTCGVGFLLDKYVGLAGVEYLHDGSGGYVPFHFDDPVITPTFIFGITAWTGGVFGRNAEGAFTYDSGTGRLSSSAQSGEQYALFRRVGPETTQYFLGIEDILLAEDPNDRDYNDYGVTFSTQTVPEPSTLLLMSTPIVGWAMRRLRPANRRRP